MQGRCLNPEDFRIDHDLIFKPFSTFFPHIAAESTHFTNKEYGFMSGICRLMQEMGRRIPYAFLEEIKGLFLSKYESEAREGIAYSLDDQFRPVLEERIAFFSSSNEADAINRVRNELGQVRSIMIENIDKVSNSCHVAW